MKVRNILCQDRAEEAAEAVSEAVAAEADLAVEDTTVDSVADIITTDITIIIITDTDRFGDLDVPITDMDTEEAVALEDFSVFLCSP